jgi:hypothetical protein
MAKKRVAFGYMRLARLLGAEVLASSYIALVLYAGVRIGEGLVVYVLRARPLRTLFMVQQHRELLQRRLNLTLRWAARSSWCEIADAWTGIKDLRAVTTMYP